MGEGVPPIKERIYIGGLDPPRLSGNDVLRRLKSINKIEIQSVVIDNHNDDDIKDGATDDDDVCDGNGNKPYLHVTVVSKDDNSALSIISKLYHNVKWKGCKLVVEAAKPHFLERLKQERQQRAKEMDILATYATIDLNSDAWMDKTTGRIPRRLRIRKKHGDMAFNVDTKPWTVDSWHYFNRARSKLLERSKKHFTDTITNKKNSKDIRSAVTPLMHRAVHIRFTGEASPVHHQNQNSNSDTIDITSHKQENIVENDNGTKDMGSSDESSSVLSSNDGDSSNEYDDIEKVSSKISSSKRYTWSDDDSSSNGSITENNGASDETGYPGEKNLVLEHEVFPYNNHEKEEGEKLFQEVSMTLKEEDINDEPYHWSIEDKLSDINHDNDSEEDEDPSSFNKNNIDKQFEAIKYSDTDNQRGDRNIEYDLIGDVSSNLNILSSIFPDMIDAKPVNPNNGDDLDLDNPNINLCTNRNKSEANGIMPRYDPNAKSSRQYLVENMSIEQDGKDISHTNESFHNNNSEDDTLVEDDCYSITKEKLDKSVENKVDTTSAMIQDVYEQDQLENVFRNARDAWEGQESQTILENDNSAREDSALSSRASAFSFGFNLSDNDNAKKQKEVEKNPTEDTFSFSFNIPGQAQVDSNTKESSSMIGLSTRKQKDVEYTHGSITSRNESEATENVADDVVTPRRRGLSLPEQDLKSFVDNFFGCNDGFRIMRDVDGFKNDHKERATWNRERQSLTLDWKRKRKYAITRIQKRMKTSRR